MNIKKLLLTYLWLAPAMFALITLVSYSNDLYNDGALKLGFPKAFFSKSYGMSVLTGEVGVTSHFYAKKLLLDIGFAMIVAVLLLICYTLFKRKKKYKSLQ